MTRAILLLTATLVLPVPSFGQDDKPWTKPGEQVGQEIIGPDGGRMVWALAGEFIMGLENGVADEKPAHKVKLTRGFWLGRCEVTNEQYARFLNGHGKNEDPEGHKLIRLEGAWRELERRGDQYVASPGRERHPVVGVTWYGAAAYAQRYGMRLPTEAEWEYAARGPEGRKYPWGDKWDAKKCCNWYNRGAAGPSKAMPQTMQVGSIPAGAAWCGALDMAGNAYEWCEDWYSEGYYANSPAEDPRGPSDGWPRIARGGSWVISHPRNFRAASRFRITPTLRYDSDGFRVVAPANDER